VMVEAENTHRLLHGPRINKPAEGHFSIELRL